MVGSVIGSPMPGGGPRRRRYCPSRMADSTPITQFHDDFRIAWQPAGEHEGQGSDDLGEGFLFVGGRGIPC